MSWPTGDCYTSSQYAGGEGGTAFVECNGQAPVSLIEVWSDDERVRGIRLTYWNDVRSGVCGNTAHKYQKLSLARDERATRIMLWPSKENNAQRAYSW
jgi:hypothetical protein